MTILGCIVWIWTLPPNSMRIEEVRRDVTEVDSNGNSFTRSGDFDAYTWMRAARNLLATGDPCDERVQGVCRSTKTLGKQGIPWEYATNLHVYAVAGWVWVSRALHAEIPVSRAPMDVALLVALLGTLGLFILGYRIGGAKGAVSASFLPALQPIFMLRSRGGDNDCWQFTLPVLAALALSESFRSLNTRRVVFFAGLAGAMTALLAWAWSGWIFFHGVWVAALLITWFVDLFTKQKKILGGIRLLAYFVVATTGGLICGGKEAFLTSLTRLSATQTTGIPWPNSFAFVSELRPSDFSDLAESVGGAWCILLAAFGVLGALAGTFRNTEKGNLRGVPILIGLWLIAGSVVALRGFRFLEFVATPVALGWAFLIETELKEFLARKGRRYGVVAWALVLLLQVPVLKNALAETETHPLGLSDAWRTSLSDLRSKSAPNAIVHSWWDYGYWIQYYSDRRTSADGGTLGTHALHWLSQSLLVPESESLGTFRMLGCGADALPLPEGKSGSLSLAIQVAKDDLGGYELLRSLLRMDRAGANRVLNQRGVPTELSKSLLAATHCMPSESWIVLSNHEIEVPPWIYLGGSNVRALKALALVREGGVETAQKKLINQSGVSESEATSLAQGAKQAISQEATEDYAAPLVKNFFHLDPLLCRTGDMGNLECHSLDGQKSINVPLGGEPEVRMDGHEGIAELTVSVDETQKKEELHKGATLDGTAVVIDRIENRAWIMPSVLARSTFVSLMFLDAKHMKGFEKVSERTSNRGDSMEKVVTFRINWSKVLGESERQSTP